MGFNRDQGPVNLEELANGVVKMDVSVDKPGAIVVAKALLAGNSSITME